MTQSMARRPAAEVQLRGIDDLEQLEKATGFSLPDLAEMIKPGGAAPNANTTQLITFCLTAHAHGLDPRKRQCYYIPRGGKYTFQTGIDGYASIASRTGRDGGVDPPRYRGHLTVGRGKLDVPEEVEVTVWKLVGPSYIPRPFTGVATWSEYAPSDIDDSGSSLWKRYPRRMLAKCATAQALRMAFPEQLGDVELTDEGERYVEVAERAPVAQPQLAQPEGRRTYAQVFEDEDQNERRMAEQTAAAKAQQTVDKAQEAARQRQLDLAEIDRQRKEEGLTH